MKGFINHVKKDFINCQIALKGHLLELEDDGRVLLEPEEPLVDLTKTT